MTSRSKWLWCLHVSSDCAEHTFRAATPTAATPKVMSTTNFSSSSPPNSSDEASCSEDTSAKPIFIAVYSVVFLLSLLFNGFTMRVYFCWGLQQQQQQRQSSVTVFLQNLAAADFLLSMCLPLRIANYASDSCLVQKVYCNFGAPTLYLNMYASILFMEYIAANRYLKIKCPLGRHALRNVRTARILSATTWGFLLATCGAYVTTSLVTDRGTTASSGLIGCDGHHSAQLRLLYKIFHGCLAGLFLFVLASLIFFYYSTTQRLKGIQQSNTGKSSGCKKIDKSKRNMLVLVVVFCVCFLPYHLVRLPFALQRIERTPSKAFYYLKEVTVVLSVLNACLDPFIYFIFCKAFRSQLGVRAGLFTTTGQTDTNNGLSGDRRLSEGIVNLKTKEKRTSGSTSRRTSEDAL